MVCKKFARRSERLFVFNNDFAKSGFSVKFEVQNMGKAFLILANGAIFEGKSIGFQGKTVGETVFTTGMTGYFETLTDPSYFGQIVTQTFPLIGNYGVIPQDAESCKSWVKGYIVRELCDLPCNFRCENSLDSYLKSQMIIGICGIDTRALTKMLRESGVMNGMILSGSEAELSSEKISIYMEEIKNYKINAAVKSVSTNVTEKILFNEFKEKKDENKKVVLWDFGAKANIFRELQKRGCKVITVPYDTLAEEIASLKPDGIMLSNGPGNPAENVEIINEIKKLCKFKIPVFGICLGHQLLALARGAKTLKLKYGHRGANHPVKNSETGRIYITSQNHGYAVETESLPPFAKMNFINVNDETCEGIKYCDIPAFSVQFHPEACGGPKDTNFLFDDFIKMMEKTDGIK